MSGPRRKKGLGYRGSICVIALVVVFGGDGAEQKFVSRGLERSWLLLSTEDNEARSRR